MLNMKNMFFITCFQKVETDDKGWLDTGATRTFGFADDFEYADTALNENRLDMHEFLYKFALVEEIQPGIHGDCVNRWFYKWDNEKKGFFRADEPEDMKSYANLALG